MSAPLANREEVERWEREHLVSVATLSSEACERPEPEPLDPFRACFARDRDRVLHCGAFRRLKDKTQVFVIDEGDFYRTRLTHTLEVTQLARYLCRALRLNEDLAEVLALVHDIGHPPFGHEGERILSQRTGVHFDHNQQALRIVDVLESPYADRKGLNLTQVVRRMILKHGGDAGRGAEPTVGHVLEAQAADIADSTAYHHHDLEDGVRAGILTTAELSELSVWREAAEAVGRQPSGPAAHKAILSHMLKTSLHDILTESSRAIDEAGLSSAAEAAEAAAAGRRLVRFSEARRRQHDELGRFLFERFYRHPRVLRSSEVAQRAIAVIVDHYDDHPDQLPADYRRRIDTDSPERSVCDYVAGMTDRFAMDEADRLTSLRMTSVPGPTLTKDGSSTLLDEDALERVAGLEATIGYVFRDKSLAAMALTHASARSDDQAPNERLEFLGDSVLGVVIADELYHRFPDRPEGELSRIRSSTVSRHALRSVADLWYLGERIILGPGFREPEDVPPSLTADAVEAVLGAVYLDADLEVTRRIILADFGPLIESAAEGRRSRNAKSALQAFTQGEMGLTPHYQVLEEEGPGHRKVFTIAAVLDGVQVAVGTGRNKRQAEQRSARDALALLKEAAAGRAPLPGGLQLPLAPDDSSEPSSDEPEQEASGADKS